MNSNTRTPSTMNARQVLAHLTKLTDAIEGANNDLADFLLELVEAEQWTQLSWGEVASAMHVSRQAVQQRVARLLASGARRRAKRVGVSPDQSSLDDLIREAEEAIPPAKGRKR